MTGPISVRLVGAAVALGFSPESYGEVYLSEWLAHQVHMGKRKSTPGDLKEAAQAIKWRFGIERADGIRLLQAWMKRGLTIDQALANVMDGVSLEPCLSGCLT